MQKQQGFSLIEIIVALAILVLIIAIVLPSFKSFKNSQILKATTEEILSSLNKAKSQTLSSVNSSEYGVHFQSDKIVIFKGIVYSAVDANNEVINISSPATISTITLSGGGSDLYFNRLSGAPNKNGTIVVVVSSLSKTVSISAVGSASVN